MTLPEWMDARKLSIRRRIGGGLFQIVNYLTVAAVLLMLVAILFELIKGSLPAWHWSTLVTVSQGLGGGLANALIGTLWLSLLTLLLVVPLGLATATFLTMYAPSSLRELTLLISDVLAGVPSIVFGYVGYIGFVIAFGWGFSASAAALTLSMMVLPYMIRNAQIALNQIPQQLSEQAVALGFTRARMTISILWPSARRGITSGAILAIAIAMGETAPLIYTANWSQNLPTLALTHHSVGYLTYVVWTYVQQPYPAAVALAYMAGLILIGLIAVMAILGRLARR